uniref:Uncharacterized protein n=1 Tax=Triticum urartu TaxID=4572 RepID=A0A8R7V3K8_TRIUA
MKPSIFSGSILYWCYSLRSFLLCILGLSEVNLIQL